MASNKIQFRSIHELKDPTLNGKWALKEFQNEIPVDEFLEDAGNSGTSRRDFLKILGFSTAAVTLAACEAPVLKTIPYVVKPHDIILGIPNFYASSYFDGFDFASVLVKTREGRPIKIEANPTAGSLGKTNARAQASVLSLYDNDKVKLPALNGDEQTDFNKIDDFVLKGLTESQASGKKIVVLSHSFPSPTFKKLFGDFKTKYPSAELITYDAIPYAAALDAAQEVFGQRALPVYDLSTSQLVVSFQADFLGDYNASSLEVSYAAARKPGQDMLRHIQVESNLSLTGANADSRYRLKPSAVFKTLVEVYNGLNGGTADKTASEIVKELQAKGSNAVVLADGSKAAYVLAHLINQKLGSKAFTGKANFLKEYDNARFNEFLSWLNGGQVGVLISNNVNPIYSHAKGKSLKAALSKVPYSVAITDKKNDIYKASKAVIPATHWLESWGDIAPETGAYSLMQPTIQKIFKSRQVEESLLVWINGKNSPANNYYEYLKANALTLNEGKTFNKTLYNGFTTGGLSTGLAYSGGNAAQAVAELSAFKPAQLELQLYTKQAIGDGTQSNNPWLMELPDPISRLSWDNYLTISPKDAEALKLENSLNARMQLDGDLVNVTVNGVTLKDVPVFIQPGQAEGSLGLALGYGKKDSGKVADTGINAYPLFDGYNTVLTNVKIEKTGEDYEFAGMQLQNTLMGRYEIAKEVSLEDFINKPTDEWNKPLAMHTIGGELPIGKIDLWDAFDDTDGPHFNLSVDLNSCTGCGACVVACQAENNVAVVGKEEIRMSRDMYWLRIDRYYSAIEKIETKEQIDRGLNAAQLYGGPFTEGILNHPADNPDVIFQPVMCQHCNHAPCETVCPVAATSHGKQGQNQMAYNRCIGTRYCANNCPYKVRRFNWFNYALNDRFDFNMNNDLGRMVLNPDVVTRTRGVMEKCSMCIQMTQSTILEAKKDGRRVKDGEFQVACANACSTGSLKFGDMNDVASEVRSLFNSTRKYVLLEEIGTKPNVFYHTKIRNRKESLNNK
ncbi:TAT-variant-translocated molybdopterin oxidoreductase [Epilithonimonas ginsengisoli]|uniref:TAT-variant-translocated molybdopterin oxidoreductase n=1 Tax=Epilithonimonas ginsengisoli TaxID=1245592 RepID=A0ABU4JEG0_9FLAO|nr:MULTISPECIES: TAT-variant-translocated molybdopterin oxidoreductase [Chryseobacterium group]MBV6879426.1 TAT-variant-translocated molybdopterin oxidoreductase [Epilithonimonas sp. FP105]MDW8548062.1 TAT-variant-translocated molybdopterin oxidoreductase [Epilithonimonas ginsengisoli]OAH64496.1 quinol:cytochrome C oxidoreductase [Chryseobacterium sp. FP211-J200]